MTAHSYMPSYNTLLFILLVVSDYLGLLTVIHFPSLDTGYFLLKESVYLYPLFRPTVH